VTAGAGVKNRSRNRTGEEERPDRKNKPETGEEENITAGAERKETRSEYEPEKKKAVGADLGQGGADG
jgi:hypothetical protein